MDQSAIELVAENLRRWQDTIWMQREEPSSPAMSAILMDVGLEAAIELGQTEAEFNESVRKGREKQAARRRRQDELEVLYGEAVRQVRGAEAQDLVLLDEVGALLVKLNKDAKPNYFLAKVSGEKYLATIGSVSSSS